MPTRETCPFPDCTRREWHHGEHKRLQRRYRSCRYADCLALAVAHKPWCAVHAKKKVRDMLDGR